MAYFNDREPLGRSAGTSARDGRRSPTAVKAVAFLPQKFVESKFKRNLADDVVLLRRLMARQELFLTPSCVSKRCR